MRQKFARVRYPQTNGKAERVIKIILEMWWHENKQSLRHLKIVDSALSDSLTSIMLSTLILELVINMTLYEKLRNFFF